jgi:Ferrochelatase
LDHQKSYSLPANRFPMCAALPRIPPRQEAEPALFASPSKPADRQGVVLLNMGGPSTVPEVYDFLSRLFSDADLIPLGRFQSWLGPLIARRRTPMIENAYRAIGGGSPIRRWSELQAREICQRLDACSPTTGIYRSFRDSRLQRLISPSWHFGTPLR